MSSSHAEMEYNQNIIIYIDDKIFLIPSCHRHWPLITGVMNSTRYRVELYGLYTV